ncbi:MAG: hydroxymethylbilane synthase [Candidatus Tectomicrobia bacterium]|uniref:Porphobilinogen deaminase n=1 Tax=Tectimicrobiota bacterium TaxID=2528274 RepID=A0A938B5R1_UNCTE|nr:hydroxymethylbilane synthase [Candidatus Tectomicrobia bacterium]
MAHTPRHARIGTRGSPMALWQANWVAQALRTHHPDLSTELVVIRTSGDRNRQDPLPQIGGKGLFVKEIEEALLRQDIDLAVHSMKDVPTTLPPGLHLSAVPPRDDVRDAFVGRHGQRLSEARGVWRIGTSSLRRRAQLLVQYRDLQVQDIRGNVDTRLRKMHAGEVDGVVVSAAGMVRLGLQTDITEVLPVEVMLPAAGQGALGIETRIGDWIDALVQPLHDPVTASAVASERAFLRHLGGGCTVPIAALAQCQDTALSLQGLVSTPDGTQSLRHTLCGSIQDPEQLGERLAAQMRANGAEALLAALDHARPL